MEKIEEIVHIVPLGHEIDRAVKPFERYKANKVVLLAVTETFGKYSQEMIKKQKYYLEIVMNKLKERGIEVEHRNIDMFDMLEVIKSIANLIAEEKGRGNRVYVNISGAGRLTSAAATLAAMAHGVKAYYVSAEGYSENKEDKMKHGLSICRKAPRVELLETFQLQLPKEEGIKVLVKLCREGKGMKTTEILEHLASEKVEGFEKCAPWRKVPRKERFNYLMKLNKRILEKLDVSGYITRERRGRYNLIKVTKAGAYVAHISGQLK